jgi:small subunit ribosomal protein S6
LPSLADAPGTSREYETIYILRPGTTNEGVAEVNQRVRGIIEGLGGKVLKVDNWGKRRLAYEVEKERKGIYLHWQYLATRGVVDEVERNMRMLDIVIRYMSVKLEANIDPEARPTEIDDEAYVRASNTAADEEDMYLTRSENGFDDDDDDDDDDDGGRRYRSRDKDDVVPGAAAAAAAAAAAKTDGEAAVKADDASVQADDASDDDADEKTDADDDTTDAVTGDDKEEQ